jgi:hypothetical protein
MRRSGEEAREVEPPPETNTLRAVGVAIAGWGRQYILEKGSTAHLLCREAARDEEMAIQKVNGTQSWIARPSVAKKARPRQLRGDHHSGQRQGPQRGWARGGRKEEGQQGKEEELRSREESRRRKGGEVARGERERSRVNRADGRH